MLLTVHSRLAAVLLCVLLDTAPAGAQAGHGAMSVCSQVPGITAELTVISGMKLRHAVPCAYITKEQINRFLNKRVKEVATPADERAEELTLKKFGLVPQDFNLAKNEVDLLRSEERRVGKECR